MGYRHGVTHQQMRYVFSIESGFSGSFFLTLFLIHLVIGTWSGVQASFLPSG